MTSNSPSRNRQDYSIWTPVSIRYSDQDPNRHVNNVAITAFLESGRTGMLREIFPMGALPVGSMVLASLTVDYLKEILFPGTVDVGARLASVGQRSFKGHFAIFQNDVCCVTSSSVNVFFDSATRTSASPSPDAQAALDRHIAVQGLIG